MNTGNKGRRACPLFPRGGKNGNTQEYRDYIKLSGSSDIKTPETREDPRMVEIRERILALRGKVRKNVE